VIEEPAVTLQIAASVQTWPRFDEIWDGLVWLIAHNGHAIGAIEREIGGVGHYVYTYEGDTVAGYPRIVVAYRYGMGRFTVRWLVVSAPPKDDVL
jgi:hypothetical protein